MIGKTQFDSNIDVKSTGIPNWKMKWDSGRNRETNRFKKGIAKAIGIKIGIATDICTL